MKLPGSNGHLKKCVLLRAQGSASVTAKRERVMTGVAGGDEIADPALRVLNIQKQDVIFGAERDGEVANRVQGGDVD